MTRCQALGPDGMALVQTHTLFTPPSFLCLLRPRRDGAGLHVAQAQLHARAALVQELQLPVQGHRPRPEDSSSEHGGQGMEAKCGG